MPHGLLMCPACGVGPVVMAMGRKVDAIRRSGFTVTELEHTALPLAPAYVRPTILGRAEHSA